MRVTESQRTDTQTHDMDDHVDDMTRSYRHLSQCGVSHIIQHAHCAGEKVTCEVLLSTPPVGCSRLLSAVNETYCNKHFLK